jgi:hypothetical protein
MDLTWTLISLVLTLMVFSYLLGDNILFRIATYILVGVSAGYLATIIVYQVILPRMIWPILNGSYLLPIIPLVLSLLLISKMFPRFANIGNISMAFVVGVTAAVVIGGAVIGTLFGQISATIAGFDLHSSSTPNQSPIAQLIGGSFILIGTVTTLAYFNFGGSSKPNQVSGRPPMVELLSRIGEIFIAIALGAIFAGVLIASVTALIERLDFIKNALMMLLLKL